MASAHEVDLDQVLVLIDWLCQAPLGILDDLVCRLNTSLLITEAVRLGSPNPSTELVLLLPSLELERLFSAFHSSAVNELKSAPDTPAVDIVRSRLKS